MINPKDKVILIVEDNPLIIFAVKKVLNNHGFNVLVSSNKLEATRLIKYQNINLIICDICLDDDLDGGINLVNLMSDILNKIPVIAYTGFSSETDRSRILSCGFDDFIAKPCVPEILIEKIINLLELYEDKKV